MPTTNCHINALLANTSSDDHFSMPTIARLAPAVSEVIQKSPTTVSRALFIYYAALEDCTQALLDNIRSLFDKKIQVECIQPGMESEMIDGAECLVVGGGNLKELTGKMAPYAMNIWQKVMSGAPYIGVNAGAEFLSSLYINLPSSMCTQFNYFPLQFVHGYSETPEGMDKVRVMLQNHPELLYALCMPTSDEGGGIMLEDAKTGLAGNQTDFGGGTPPGIGQELYIFEPDGTNGMREVPWTQQQRKDLPINYW